MGHADRLVLAARPLALAAGPVETERTIVTLPGKHMPFFTTE